MGRKKKLSASRSKTSSTAPPSSTVDQTSSTTPPPFDVINRALTAFRHENYTKALKIIKDSLSKNNNSEILHKLSGEIHYKLATILDDPNTKLKHLINSAESHHRATLLSPDSLSSSHFYLKTLFELSKHNKDFDKVIQECDRGLSIQEKNPFVDRIEKTRNEIREIKKRINVVKIIDFDAEEKIKIKRERECDLKELIKRKEKKIYNQLETKIERARILRRKFELDLGFITCSTSNRLSDEKTERVRKYWNERMSDERKKRLLEVRIDEVEKYFDKNEAAREVFKEGIDYAKKKGDWKFFECCLCGEKFVDGEKLVKHYKEEHIGILSEKLRKILPGGVEDETVEMIRNGDWRPVDTIAVVEIWKKNQSGVDVEWPISDDNDRATVLECVRSMFQLFLTCRLITVSLIVKMEHYAKRKLEGLIPESEFKIRGLGENLQCLRFLGVSELNDALKFLMEVHSLCDLIRRPGISENHVVSIIEKISFSSDFKCLLLDDKLLQGGLIRDMYKNSVADDGSALAPAVDITYDMMLISDDIIDWLFMNSPIEEQLATWTKLRGEKLGGTEVFEILVTEVSNLKTLCGRKYDIYSCNEAYAAVEKICLVEVQRMKKFPECEPQVFASLLKKRRKTVTDRDGGAVFRSTQLQLDAIRDVLEEALSLSFNIEECGKDNDWIMQDCLGQANSFILEAIQRQRRRMFDELAKIDAMILQTVAAVQQFEQILWFICAYDYRSIMLPLLKLFIQAHLEDLIDKDASEMSDAAQSLVELALDAKKNISKGGDHAKSKEFETTGGNEHPLLDQEDVEPVSSDVPVASPSADELKEQEEELKNKIEPEEGAREHPAETPEYPRQIEKEEEEKRSIIMFENFAFTMPDKQLDSEVSGVSYYEKSQQDLLVDEIGIPEDTFQEEEEETFEDFLLKERQKMLGKTSLEGEEFGPLPTDAKINDKNESVEVRTGLKNDFGENNCFLNVIIQALWNLRQFRDEFMNEPVTKHAHTEDLCVVCELYKIFAYLCIPATEMPKEPVDPASFRIALSELHHSFRTGEMNDASEVLHYIFEFLHRSFTSSLGVSVAASKGNYGGSWDCATGTCLVHTHFGMNILEETNCDCGHKSRQLEYTSFFHMINANELRSMKSQHGDSSFDELLKLVANIRQSACDSKEGGCGKLNHICNILSTPPRFFTAVLLWQTAYENVDDISETLRALTTEIDLGLLYPNLDSGNTYCLVSVVCYYRLHYICFAYRHESKTWILYDDKNVKDIGCWSDVHTTCEQGHYQPLVLFFEAS